MANLNNHVTEDIFDFKQMVENSLGAIMIVDDKQNHYANKAALRMLKVNKEDFLQESFHKFLHEDYHAICKNRLYQVIHHGKVAEMMEQKMIRADGEVFDVEIMASPYFLNDNIYALIHIHDIKERKEAEKLLIQSEKLSMLGEISAGIVHEIRNPLTSLKGFIQLMKLDDNRNPKYIKIMEDELERVQTIANDLLKYSKPQDEIYSEVNLVSVIDDVIFLLETELFKKQVQVEFTHELPSVFVNGSESQLKQVLLNLLKNALDASQENKKIFISVDTHNGNVLIKIKDQGYGIQKEEIEKMGTSFFTTKEKGTGLGLMVSYNIIKNHKGIVEVKSEVGIGTTFFITIPAFVK